MTKAEVKAIVDQHFIILEKHMAQRPGLYSAWGTCRREFSPDVVMNGLYGCMHCSDYSPPPPPPSGDTPA